MFYNVTNKKTTFYGFMRALHPLLDITRKSPLGLVESPFLVCRDPQYSSAKHGKFSWKQPMILMWFCLLDVWNDLHPLVFSDVFCQHSQSCVTLCYNMLYYIYICSVSSHNLVLHACNLGRSTLLQWSSLSCDRMRLVKLYINSSRQQQKVFARFHPLKRTVTGYTHHHPSPSITIHHQQDSARLWKYPHDFKMFQIYCKKTVKHIQTSVSHYPHCPKHQGTGWGSAPRKESPNRVEPVPVSPQKSRGSPTSAAAKHAVHGIFGAPLLWHFFWKETQQMRELVVA